jgi:3-oxoacyl-[acyl-carrier protein] reductase
VGGASQGLGRAIAFQLAESGATVTVMARNEEKLKRLVEDLPKPTGQKHEYLVVDFSDFAQYCNILRNYFSTHTIDILVNNTNGPKAGTVTEKNEQDYQAAFNLLFQTVQFTTTLALPAMQNNHFGRIINLTSRTVKEPVDNLVLSNSMRAAVVAWGKTLATAMAPFNITVNNILTGNFDTERLKQLFSLQAAAKNVSLETVTSLAQEGIPARRLGRPEEMGWLVTFLASDQASYITGTSIPIDGGLMKSI